jgi:predicted metal-dependent RNase
MAKRPAPIRKAEIERIVKGVIATGLAITRIEVEGGKFVIYTNESAAHQESPLEAWRRENGQS